MPLAQWEGKLCICEVESLLWSHPPVLLSVHTELGRGEALGMEQ